MSDIASIAVAAAKVVVPYLVALKAGALEGAGHKAGEIVVDKTLEGAKGVWSLLTSWYKDDEFISLSGYLKASPESQISQKTMATELGNRLEQAPEKAAELQKLLGGDAAINKIIAGEGAVVELVRQKITGSGQNIIEGGKDSQIKDAIQEITNPE